MLYEKFRGCSYSSELLHSLGKDFVFYGFVKQFSKYCLEVRCKLLKREGQIWSLNVAARSWTRSSIQRTMLRDVRCSDGRLVNECLLDIMSVMYLIRSVLVACICVMYGLIASCVAWHRYQFLCQILGRLFFWELLNEGMFTCGFIGVQAGSRWLHSSEALAESQGSPCGIYGYRIGTGASIFPTFSVLLCRLSLHPYPHIIQRQVEDSDNFWP